MKFYTQEEILDKHIGKKGTVERACFDADIESALIGASIREARRAKRLTQSQLGEIVGVQSAQISKIEHGRNLTISTIVRVLKALGVTANFEISMDGLMPVVLGQSEDF